jgi:hypothetical protein
MNHSIVHIDHEQSSSHPNGSPRAFKHCVIATAVLVLFCRCNSPVAKYEIPTAQTNAQVEITQTLQKSNNQLEQFVQDLGGNVDSIVTDSTFERLRNFMNAPTRDPLAGIVLELQLSNTLKRRLILALGGKIGSTPENAPYLNHQDDLASAQTYATLAISQELQLSYQLELLLYSSPKLAPLLKTRKR